jgi:hypothetical protein
MCRVLEVGLSKKVSRQGISALRQLTCLEEFHSTEPNFLRYCYELLPHLHINVLTPVPFNNEDLWRHVEDCRMALRGITTPLKLHHLALYTLNEIPENVALPELRMLYLGDCGNPAEMQLPAGRLPKLTELTLFNLYNETLMHQVVAHGVGRQLQTLRVSFYDNSVALRLDEVLDACPNLTELCLDGKDLQSAGELRPETCRQLRILRLSSSDYRYSWGWEPYGCSKDFCLSCCFWRKICAPSSSAQIFLKLKIWSS